MHTKCYDSCVRELLLTLSEKELFLEQVWEYYQRYGRHDLPWRIPQADSSFDPYTILVSELMLQQTQVARVIPKYRAFLAQFPTSKALASATLGEVLTQWQGLGYNRRAKFIRQAAKLVTERGDFPTSTAELLELPGVGINTAGAIQAYAFNQPAIFIETNIRTVYIHHFLPQSEAIPDSTIRSLLTQTLDTERPRDFYWALMDYGTWLKTNVRTNSQSKHYVRQSKFEGSKRQIRGYIIRALTAQPMSRAQLYAQLQDSRLDEVLRELEIEAMIVKKRTKYSLY